jgi:hypothetical protein
LAVIAEGGVALGDRGMDAFTGRQLDEPVGIGGVAHEPVQDRAKGLGAAQSR